MVLLMRELRAHAAQVPAGEGRGLFFLRKYRCACGGLLEAVAGSTLEHAFELSVTDAEPFTAILALRRHRCSSCGREQARSGREIAAAVPELVRTLNDAAGFPHSG